MRMADRNRALRFAPGKRLVAGLLLVLSFGLGSCSPDGEGSGRGAATGSTTERTAGEGSSTLIPTETLRLRGGVTRIYREGSLYAFRRNDWTFYCFAQARSARARSLEAANSPQMARSSETATSPQVARSLEPARPVEAASDAQDACVIVHFDSHSDMHPAPVCADSVGLVGGRLEVAEQYADRLSVATFMLPCLYYGLAQEVYWVQPEISCYAGESETYRFDLHVQDGWILPRIREGATPIPLSAMAMRVHQGLPVSRADDLVTATRPRHATEDWVPGPFRLHCLSRAQFDERVRSGTLDGCRVLVDLDLDYFGTGGEMRGYGYLALPRRGQVAVGLLGGTLPVFYQSPGRRQNEMEVVAHLLARLAPEATCLCESPDHAHRDQIPAMAGFFRHASRRSARALDEHLPRPRVHLRAATGRHELAPACARRIDLAGADSLLVEVAWDVPPPDSAEVSVYFNPSGSEDRLVARWRLIPTGVVTVHTLVASPGSWSAYLGQGWELEIRELHRGQLLYTAAFALDDGLAHLRAAVADLVDAGLVDAGPARADSSLVDPVLADPALACFDPAHVAELPPSQVIARGRTLGLPTGRVHRIILAHPRSLAWQCENLKGYRAGPGTLR